jgi:hypothetical protein
MPCTRCRSPKPIPRDPVPVPQPRRFPEGEPIPGPIGPKGGDASLSGRPVHVTSA